MSKAKRALFRQTKADAGIREFKSVSFELESADVQTGEFSGYASVFGNVDDGGDIVEKGAFAKTIVEDFARIKILALHNGSWLPVGKPLELREDDHGLFIRGRISDTSMGRDIQTLLKDGVLNELSIGYDAVDYVVDESTGIRHLKQIKLWEVSIVTWAMNDQAQIDGVKSLMEGLKAEAKSGRITRSRMDALRLFIAMVKELADILDPIGPDEDGGPADTSKTGTQPNISKSSTPKKQKKTKTDGMIFEIVHTTNGR